MKVVKSAGSLYYGWEIITLGEACKREGIDPNNYHVDPYYLTCEVCYKAGKHTLCWYEVGKRSYYPFPRDNCEFIYTFATLSDGSKQFIVST